MECFAKRIMYTAGLVSLLTLGTHSAQGQQPVPMPNAGRLAPADAERPYTFVEEMPVFPGGRAALLATLQRTVRYPRRIPKPLLEGRVFVQFVVRPDGSVARPVVIKGLGNDYDAEAVRAVRALPRFRPGRQLGRAVPVLETVPIEFRLP